MDVNELFQKLSYGELSNLSISGEGSGTIIPDKRPRVIAYANEALLKLYGRFLLKERDVLVMMYEHITNYHLIPRFAVQYVPESEEDDEPIRYILDLPREPFEDEVLRLLVVHDGDGDRLPLNDAAQSMSVFTPQAKVLQVPRPQPDQTLSVGYQCRHKPLVLEDLGKPIELPEVLHEALTAYVAYKVFSHMNTQDSTAKANEHMTLFEAICKEVTGHDLLSTSEATTNTRFEKRGWI